MDNQIFLTYLSPQDIKQHFVIFFVPKAEMLFIEHHNQYLTKIKNVFIS